MKLGDYRCVQAAAKAVHAQLKKHIHAESTERSIAEVAVQLLAEHGITATWYHNVPALVLLGSRSCASLSGRHYIPGDEAVGMTNLVTVDLSPKVGSVWGDCARSYVVEQGKVVDPPAAKEFAEGLAVEALLHKEMMSFVTPRTRFSELYDFANRRIIDYGYENLDFLSNLGHSIETDPSRRRFIDSSCQHTLGEVRFFTFEPHIKKACGRWGFKHEDIYYFDKGQLAVL